MITYNSIKTREDSKFHRVARRVLGSDYGAACEESSEVFKSSYDPSLGVRSGNVAKRAANLVILRWLREWGVADWTTFDNGAKVIKPVDKSMIGGKMEKPSGRDYKSSCGLWAKKL